MLTNPSDSEHPPINSRGGGGSCQNVYVGGNYQYRLHFVQLKGRINQSVKSHWYYSTQLDATQVQRQRFAFVLIHVTPTHTYLHTYRYLSLAREYSAAFAESSFSMVGCHWFQKLGETNSTASLLRVLQLLLHCARFGLELHCIVLSPPSLSRSAYTLYFTLYTIHYTLNTTNCTKLLCCCTALFVCGVCACGHHPPTVCVCACVCVYIY